MFSKLLNGERGRATGGEKGFPRTPHIFQGKRKAALYFTKGNPVSGFGLRPEYFFLSPVTFLSISCFSGFCPGAPAPGKGVKK